MSETSPESLSETSGISTAGLMLLIAQAAVNVNHNVFHGFEWVAVWLHEPMYSTSNNNETLPDWVSEIQSTLPAPSESDTLQLANYLLTREDGYYFNIQNNTFLDKGVNADIWWASDPLQIILNNNIFSGTEHHAVAALGYVEWQQTWSNIDFQPGYNLFYGFDHPYWGCIDFDYEEVELPMGEGDIRDEDPLLTEDYHLQANSLCIDAGDPDSPDDPDGTIADMGAYYYDQLIIPTNLSISGEVGDNPTLTWEYESFDHYQHHEIWRYYESLNIDGIIKGASSDYTFTDVEYVISKIDEEPDGRLRYEVKKVDPGTGHHQRVNYQVRAVNESNQPYQYSNQVHTYRLLPGAISKGTNLPTEFALSQNYPNPFNPTTVISYQLSVISEVQLTVYDLMGRVVKELVSDKITAGTHNIIWNGTDAQGQPVASGMYLYQLKTDTFVKTKKLVLLK